MPVGLGKRDFLRQVGLEEERNLRVVSRVKI